MQVRRKEPSLFLYLVYLSVIHHHLPSLTLAILTSFTNRGLLFGLEGRVVSGFVASESHALSISVGKVARNSILFAPSLPWSGKSRREFESRKLRREFESRKLRAVGRERHVVGGVASGFRPKLHSPTRSLCLESLDIRSAKTVQESKKLRRGSRKLRRGSRKLRRGSRKLRSGSRKSRHTNKMWSQKSGHKFAKVLKKFVQSFTTHVQTFVTKFWYVQTIATRDATHVQTFQTQTLGAANQFWSKSGCGATHKVWT